MIMKNFISLIVLICAVALPGALGLKAQNIGTLNNYKYAVIHSAGANGGVPRFQKFKPELESGIRSLLAQNNIPLLNDPQEALNRGAKSCEILTCTYTISYSMGMMYSAKITCGLSFNDCQNKEIFAVSGNKTVGVAVGGDGYVKLFTELMKPYSSYAYVNNTEHTQAVSANQPEPTGNQSYQQPVATNQSANNSNQAAVATASQKIVSDVDIDIPAKATPNANRFALIVGNEDYSTYQKGLSTEANVDYAVHDATVFKEYAIKTLGIPDDNIIFETNANTREMNRAIDKLSLLAKATGGEGELFFYYAGHGYPDEVTKEAYIIPVDVSGSELQYALKLKDVYRKLSEYNSKKVVCFLDACFSGGARNLSLMASRGIKIKPKADVLSGNMIVYSAVSNDQASLPYKDKAHGMFTYYLLKKLQETKGDISFGDLSEFLEKQVSVKSIMINSKEQNPTMVTSPDLGEGWKNWRMK